MKKIFTIRNLLLLIVFFSSIMIFNYSSLIEAVEDNNFNGYAWSDNAGWISFNYGTSIDDNGYLTGYAWSDSIGWITFNSAELTGCPEAPCEAKIDKYTDKISGWARVINSNNGWIRLGPIVSEGIEYGLLHDGDDVLGWAWSDELGWISFNCKNQSCIQSNYAVKYISSVVISSLNTNINYCMHEDIVPSVNDGLAVKLMWTYDGSGSDQKSYRIQISKDSNFVTDVYDKVATSSSDSMWLNLVGSSWNGEELDWATTYYWRIKVTSESGGESSWEPSSFNITKTHGSPYVVFSNIPEQIIVDHEVEFKAEKDGVASKTFNGSTPIYSWVFPGGTPSTSDQFSQIVTFSEAQTSEIYLRVTDSAGYYCETAPKPMDIYLFTPPIWKDISPF